MAFDIHGQRLILIVILAWPLYQMDVNYALASWSFHIESKPQMLRAPLILLGSAADVPIACPPRPRRFAMCRDLRTWAQQLLAASVGADARGCAVEVGCF